MFEDPDEPRSEDAIDPLDRAKDKFDEFRMHAELAAVFEGKRKFDAELRPGLDPELARDIQKTVAKLEKAKLQETPLIAEESMPDSTRILNLPQTADLTTNDYHIHRRPGEVMIARWLAGLEVESFYERFQAHFDAALNQFREEERQSQGWKQDEKTLEYLEALDAINVKMSDRYLREIIQKHNVAVLSTQTADEMDILHLTVYLITADPEDVVGKASAPPEEPTEKDRAWFFKLFSLRGMNEGKERMCFFAFLQKADEGEW